jgi:hypothetical protein
MTKRIHYQNPFPDETIRTTVILHTNLHTRNINRFLISACVAVLAVEALVILAGGQWGNILLRAAHYTLDFFLFVVVVCMRFIWNGIRFPEEHRNLAKLFMFLFVVVFITGALLLKDMPRMQETLGILHQLLT